MPGALGGASGIADSKQPWGKHRERPGKLVCAPGNSLDDEPRLQRSRKPGQTDQHDAFARLAEAINEFAEILVARQKHPALGGGFPKNCVVRGRRVGFRRVRDVEIGGAQGLSDLPIDPLVRVQIQAAVGSSG